MTDNKSQSNDNKLQSFDVVTTPGSDWEDDPVIQATLHFNLEKPEGERRLRECLDAPKAKLVLWEFDNYLRDLIKYGYDKSEPVLNELDMVRKAFWNILDYHGIRLDED